jgi:hypothetical protein
MKAILSTASLLPALMWLVPSLASASIVGFQAESGTTPRGKDAYRVQSDEDALGGQYIDSDHRSMDGGEFSVWREYSVTLPAGSYDLWGRIYIPWDFSYDPLYNNDGGAGTPSYMNDSFFLPAEFGVDPTIQSNGWRKFDGLHPDGNANAEDAYQWINMTDMVDLNGIGQTEGTLIEHAAPTYTSAGGTQVFTIKSREGGFRNDAFAFVTDGLQPTEEELSTASLVLGDFNYDEVIDSLDFGILRDHLYDHLDGPVTYSDGDIDFDSDIDLYDFRQFKVLFPGLVAAATGVPEPSSLALTLCALAGITALVPRLGHHPRRIENDRETRHTLHQRKRGKVGDP